MRLPDGIAVYVARHEGMCRLLHSGGKGRLEAGPITAKLPDVNRGILRNCHPELVNGRGPLDQEMNQQV